MVSIIFVKFQFIFFGIVTPLIASISQTVIKDKELALCQIKAILEKNILEIFF